MKTNNKYKNSVFAMLFPDEQIMRLSDAFKNPCSLGLPEKGFPALELVVKVVNINEGRNKGIAERCKNSPSTARSSPKPAPSRKNSAAVKRR
jgi:hypothetical protein